MEQFILIKVLAMRVPLLPIIFLTCATPPSSAVRITKLSVPEEVPEGGDATLHCDFGLDAGEALRSVRWFFLEFEFYRYVPEQDPRILVFEAGLPGLGES